MTLRESFAFKGLLEKIVQFGWFGTPINLSPSLLLELGMEHIKDCNSSWTKIILKDPCTSKIVLMTKLFFQMFWQKIFISFIIILESYSYLNESTVFYFFKCYFLLKWCFQKRHWLELASRSPLQFEYLNMCRHSSSCLVSSLKELVLKFALQHYAKW